MKSVLSTIVCRPLLPAASIAIVLGISQLLAAQSTGTFIDRQMASDLRIVSYNIFQDTIFPDTDAPRAAKFARVVRALNPDIVNLQEIYFHTATDAVDLMNSILPLGEGATWYAQQGHDNVIVSKFPLTQQRTNTDPDSPRDLAIALVDLPDGRFDTDFYFMNNHFRCCGCPGGTEDAERQRQADALVNWMRDARTPGGFVTLPPGTPMAVVGDLNMQTDAVPFNTLISGNIKNESTYGPDSPPDWDATPLADAHPLHNVNGPDSYTFRPGGSTRSRFDFILYTDSVATIGTKFVLNTVTMSTAERSASGLQTYDVTLDNAGSNYDHLPLIVDFRLLNSQLPGDYNSDGSVNSPDYDMWRTHFGLPDPAADGNENGMVDVADYVLWRKAFPTNGVAAASPVPEPAPKLLWVILAATAAAIRYRRPFLLQTKKPA